MSWWMILTLAVITFANRYVFLLEGLKYQPGEKVKHFMSFASYAVLTAIWAPIIFKAKLPNDVHAQFNIEHAGLDYLLASIVAGLLAFLRLPSIVVVVVSMGVFFMLRYSILD